MNLLGVVLLMVAILSVVNGKVELNKQGVVPMLVSALMFAIFQLASADISKEVSAGTYLMIGYFGPALVLLALKPRKIISDKMVAKVAMLLSAQVVITVILSYLRDSWTL